MIGRIAVDFDGTICDFAYPDIGKPKAGVREALQRFLELGYEVIIYSCRTCSWDTEIFGGGEPMARKVVKQMIEFLNDHKIPYTAIDDGSKGKPTAEYYIDDKAIRFQDNWHEIAEFVTERIA